MTPLPPGRRRATRQTDRGSVTPLIIGMVACLLVLGAGVAAGGSAFLAGQRTQNLCDGAAAAAGDAIDPAGGAPGSTEAALQAAQRYLDLRGSPAVLTGVVVDGAVARLGCAAEAQITFGWVFGHPTLHRAVTAASTPNYSR